MDYATLKHSIKDEEVERIGDKIIAVMKAGLNEEGASND